LNLSPPPGELALCVKALEPHDHVRISETPWGVSAAIGATDEARSVLEIRRDAGRPLLGKGVSVSLWTPLRGGPLDAVVLNERETATWGHGTALGRWWAPEGGFLVHSSFVPAGLFEIAQVPSLLGAYMHRADEANLAALEHRAIGERAIARDC
jgi:hypothetical protein